MVVRCHRIHPNVQKPDSVEHHCRPGCILKYLTNGQCLISHESHGGIVSGLGTSRTDASKAEHYPNPALNSVQSAARLTDTSNDSDVQETRRSIRIWYVVLMRDRSYLQNWRV